MTHRRHLLTMLALACAGTVSSWGQQQPPQAQVDRQYLIKAANLAQFGSYVQWSKDVPGTGNEFVIGVLGKDPFGMNLDKAAKFRGAVHGKNIVVRRFPTLDECKPCHVLYVSEGMKGEKPAEHLAAALKALRGASTLVVADGQGLAAKGAAISFFILENNVWLELNPAAAKRAGLQFDARLLQLQRAKIVSEETEKKPEPEKPSP